MTDQPEITPDEGFPADPPEPVDLPVPEGVREITQDPNYDAEIDEEESP